MNSTHRRLRSILLSAALGMTASAQAADYIITPLQDVPFGYGDFGISGMNASGTIVGSVLRLDSTTAVTWDATGAANPLFPGDSGESNGYAINSSDQVLIYYYGPYIWDKSVLAPLNIVSPGLRYPVPTLLNDAGQVAGNGHYQFGTTNEYRPFLLSNGTTTDLPALSGAVYTGANNINNTGEVVGYSNFSGGSSRAVLWRNGVAIDLGTLPGQTSSLAQDINDRGRIVGSSGGRIFTWENGVMTDLGVLGTGAVLTPRSINNNGDIVGSFVYPGGALGKGFLWSNGVYTDISTVLGSCIPVVINDAGQIAASCGSPSGGVRLTPTTPAADLALGMTISSGNVVVGTPFTYKLDIRNGGSLPASNVVITDSLPASVTFVSATTTQGNCTGTAVVSCALSTLAGGGSATVQITVIPNAVGPLANSASVSGNEVENNTFNNAASVSFYVNAATADMGMTMGASSTSVSRNANLTYTLTVFNNGPASANGVTLTDTLPSGMSFVSAKTSQGSCSGTTTVTCSLGTMSSTGRATVTITVQARSRGTFTNTAQVTSSVTDPSTANNSASVTVTVK